MTKRPHAVVLPIAAKLGLTCPDCRTPLEDSIGPFWCPVCERPVSAVTLLALGQFGVGRED